MRTPERVIRPDAAAFATNKRGVPVHPRGGHDAHDCTPSRARRIVAVAAIGCTPDTASQQKTAQIPTSDAYTVVDVIDGDTFDAQSPAGQVERIRLLGITPRRGRVRGGARHHQPRKEGAGDDRENVPDRVRARLRQPRRPAHPRPHPRRATRYRRRARPTRAHRRRPTDLYAPALRLGAFAGASIVAITRLAAPRGRHPARARGGDVERIRLLGIDTSNAATVGAWVEVWSRIHLLAGFIASAEPSRP